AFVTFWGTIFPLLSEAVQNQKVTVGAPFYNQVNGPLFLVLLVLMGIGPLLAWRRTSTTGLARSLRWPTAAAALLAAALWLAGLRSWAGISGFTVCLFVIGTILVEYWRGVRARRRTAGEGYGEALVTLVSRNRRRYGGYVVHLAIVVIAAGTIGSTFFQSERELTMKLGETAQVGRYTITYRGLDTWTEPGVRIVAADVLATSNGGFVGVLSPQKLFYRGWERQETTLVAVHTTLPWVEDLYVVLSGWDAAENSAVLHVFVNPLVSLIWAGGGLFLIGNVVAFWPVPARRRQVVPARPVPVLSPES
ncbi:MAG: heme lyase CcmF/NrfE family subunit, partial [Chloroflexi bacterium]|nr:heme lyase CcmF/NrfE family subunit [Chloroflexota bacterium]